MYNVHDAGLLPRGYFPIFMPLLDGSVKNVLSENFRDYVEIFVLTDPLSCAMKEHSLLSGFTRGTFFSLCKKFETLASFSLFKNFVQIAVELLF